MNTDRMSPPRPFSQWALSLTLAVGLLAPALSAMAALSSDAPITIQSQESTYNSAKQSGSFIGNVVLVQGPLQIRADRIDISASGDGGTRAVAKGQDTNPVTLVHRRDTGEVVTGSAMSVEYDSTSVQITFIGRAQLQRQWPGSAPDEVSGERISYNARSELFRVTSGQSAVAPGNPQGRTRTVIQPRPGTPIPPPAAGSSAPQLNWIGTPSGDKK